MSWNVLIGLEKEKKLLQKAILENKIASAYCFLGLEGIGKDAFALEFAKTVNCYAPIKNNNSIIACDNCKSCKMANQISHPNIQYLFPQPATEKLKEEEISSIKLELKSKIENPYHKINIPNARQIHIGLIRNVIKNMIFSDQNKGRRFIIISSGDAMNTEAANAFLKTLEEPQINTTIIITSSKREKLLQTILSRCQQIYFSPLSNEDVAKYLMQNNQKTETEANLIAAMSQGSITQAVDFLDDDINYMRNLAVEVLRISLKKIKYRVDFLNEINKIIEKKDKKNMVLFLNLLLLWLRDVYSIHITASTENVANKDLLERMINFNKGFPQANYLEACSKIEMAISRINRNIDPVLTYVSLFIELRRIFVGFAF